MKHFILKQSVTRHLIIIIWCLRVILLSGCCPSKRAFWSTPIMGGFRGGPRGAMTPPPPLWILLYNFCNQPSQLEWHCAITPRMLWVWSNVALLANIFTLPIWVVSCCQATKARHKGLNKVFNRAHAHEVQLQLSRSYILFKFPDVTGNRCPNILQVDTSPEKSNFISCRYFNGENPPNSNFRSLLNSGKSLSLA